MRRLPGLGRGGAFRKGGDPSEAGEVRVLRGGPQSRRVLLDTVLTTNSQLTFQVFLVLKGGAFVRRVFSALRGCAEVADKEPCGALRCARYEMTQLEFRRLRGELWDQSFISRLGKTASKLYREIYQKKPTLKYSRTAKRNHVHKYPCGILEQAYRQLKEQGVPLMKPDSALVRQIEWQQSRDL
jgi:hypothetical protein